MIAKIIHTIRKWREERTEASSIQEKDELVSQFCVKELNGRLYLMCQGIPFQLLPPELTADEIAKRITEARMVALHYREERKAIPDYITDMSPAKVAALFR